MAQTSLFDGAKRFTFDRPIRLIELFAGIGSQALAMKRLGLDFEHYRVCEYDKYAVCAYNAIHGTDFEPSDITEATGADLGVVDTDKYIYVMTYSFPCQDLSSAGKGKGMARGGGTRSGLLWEVERLLGELDELPQVLLMENVPEVIRSKNVKHFADWVSALDKLGYRSKWQVLNATDYGVPQNRERCFMVSIHGDYYYDFPAPVPLVERLRDRLEADVPERYYIDDAKVHWYDRPTGVTGDVGLLNGGAGYKRNIQITGGDGVCHTISAREYKDPLKVEARLEVVGTVRPDKLIQASAKVLSTGTACRTILASDHKHPPLVACGGGQL